MLSVSGDACSSKVETNLLKVRSTALFLVLGGKMRKKTNFFSIFFGSVFYLTKDVSFIEFCVLISHCLAKDKSCSACLR